MTAPRTWDVTLRFVDNNDGGHPEDWCFISALHMQRPGWWDGTTVMYLNATEVKVWRFGDIITEDNKPDVPFNAVDQTGRVRTESQSLDTGDTWRLIWLDGQELVCAATC